MKKVFAFLLCVLLIFVSIIPSVSAADDDLVVNVANDLHFSASSLVPYTGGTKEDSYSHIPTSGQMILESNAIITSFFEKIKKSESDIVLMPGDLVNAGTENEHILFSQKLAEFEEESGKKVYVINGNHDLFSTSTDEFKEYYYEFGYSEALAVDSLSASYTADLNNEYRLLAIDSCKERESVAFLTPERLSWIEAQCKQAAKDGKKLIAIMHHNLIEHYVLSSVIHGGDVVGVKYNLPEILASNGVKVIFTGHTHDQDIAKYEADNGNVIYDVVTNTLNAYPVTYRTVTFGDKIEFKAGYISSIDTNLLPEGISDKAVSLAKSNFAAYSKHCIFKGLTVGIKGYLIPDVLRDFLKIDEQNDKELSTLFDRLAPKLCEILTLPLYKTNGDSGLNSIEAVAEKYGQTLVKTDYENFIELMVTLYQAHCKGDENYPLYTDEMLLLKSTVITVLSYTLSDVTASEYELVLNYVCKSLGISAPSSLLNFAGSSLERTEGIELIVSTGFMPLAAKYTVDEAPEDNNLVLADYGKDDSTAISFLDRIRAFFNKILDFFRSLFSMFK